MIGSHNVSEMYLASSVLSFSVGGIYPPYPHLQYRHCGCPALLARVVSREVRLGIHREEDRNFWKQFLGALKQHESFPISSPQPIASLQTS